MAAVLLQPITLCTFIKDNLESFKINQGHIFKYHFSVVTTVILLPFVFTAYVIAFVRKKTMEKYISWT